MGTYNAAKIRAHNRKARIKAGISPGGRTMANKSTKTSNKSSTSSSHKITPGLSEINYDPGVETRAINDIPGFMSVGGTKSNNDYINKKNPENTIDNTDNRTYEEKGKSLVEGQFKTDYENANDLGLNLPKYMSTLEKYTKDFVNNQKQQYQYQAEQQARQKKLDEMNMAETQRQQAAATAGTTAQMAQGREGAVAGTAPAVVTQFKGAMGRRMQRIQIEMDSAQAQRDNLQQELKRAQASGKKDLASAIQGQIDNASAKLEQLDIDSVNAQSTAIKTQQTKIDTLQTTFDAMGAFASKYVDDAALQTMADGADIDFGTAAAMRAMATAKGELANAKDQTTVIEGQQKIAQLQSEIDAGLYGTADMKSFQYYSQLSAPMQAKYKELANINKGSQVVKGTDADGNDVFFSYDPTGGTLTSLGGAVNQNISTTSGSWGSIQDALNAPDGIPIDPTTGEKAKDSYNGKKGYIECAQFVNRYSGLHMGNDYGSKVGAIKSYLVNSPQVGDIFVSPYTAPNGDEVGHAGFVLGVSDDGKTVTVKDANYVAPGQIGTHEMKTDGMVFGRAGNNSSSNGDGNSLYNKYFVQAKQAGMSTKDAKNSAKKEYDSAMGSMTEAQGSAYNAFVVMTEENPYYDELSNVVDPAKSQEFANSINFIERRTKQDDLTADIISQASDNSEVRQAITSEMRWLEAALREESGAAISIAEYESKGRMYFPRPGDDEAAINRKRKMRETVTKAKKGKMGLAGERIYNEEFGSQKGNTEEDDINAYGKYYTNEQLLAPSTNSIAW